MHRIPLLLLLAASAVAQDNPFNKPPADVDAALRARINEFYDLHVKGQFRKADELVAEDTKEYYFNGNKPSYFSFEISRIDYFDNFTRAKAVIMCEMYLMIPGFNDKPIKMPTPSAWKIENGKWYWYVDQTELRKTPFGIMTPGPAAKPGQGGLPPITPGGQLPNIEMSTDFLFKQVQIDKSEVELGAGDAAEVVIANSAPGDMELKLFNVPDGVDAKLGKSTLMSNEKTTLKINTAKDAHSGTIQVQVVQTGQLLPVHIKLK
jgi:hypothetical protein